MAPSVGQFVRVRSRRWLVESGPENPTFPVVRLACIDDDATGETIEVLWDAELDGEVLSEEGWGQISKHGTDDPSVFSAYFKTLRWNTATSSDRELFQAPFRAGIHLDAFQLLPLRKALKLPRVNLLIADDVGAGKTIEAGLVLRELLLRHRIDFILVAAPAGTVRQWQDELETKFGLAFTGSCAAPSRRYGGIDEIDRDFQQFPAPPERGRPQWLSLIASVRLRFDDTRRRPSRMSSPDAWHRRGPYHGSCPSRGPWGSRSTCRRAARMSAPFDLNSRPANWDRRQVATKTMPFERIL